MPWLRVGQPDLQPTKTVAVQAPNRVHIGMSTDQDWATTVAAVEQGGGKVSVRRRYFNPTTTDWNAQLSNERTEYIQMVNEGRILWSSHKNPGGETWAAWNDVRNGVWDTQLIARGDFYNNMFSDYGVPFISTWFHEPFEQSTVDSSPGATTTEKVAAMFDVYADAYSHIYDVLASRLGGTAGMRQKVTMGPCWFDWQFRNPAWDAALPALFKQNMMDRIMESGVWGCDYYLDRTQGLDFSENGTYSKQKNHLAKIRRTWPDGRYDAMKFAIGEFGVAWEEYLPADGGSGTTSDDPWTGTTPGGTPPQILATCYEQILGNPDRWVACSYFNSLAGGSRAWWSMMNDPYEYGGARANTADGAGAYGETTTKLDRFRTALQDPRNSRGVVGLTPTEPSTPNLYSATYGATY